MDPDRPLIEALQAGDDSALDELMHRHREALFHFALRYLRDETVARDVVQETFVRVYFKSDKFTPKSLVKTWIYTISLNLCRDQGRRQMRRRGDRSLDAPTGENTRTEAVDDNPLPSTRAVAADLFAHLQHAIDQLPQKMREALILFSLEQHSQQEVAELLGVSPKTVELRVYHAKAKLRTALGHLL